MVPMRTLVAPARVHGLQAQALNRNSNFARLLHPTPVDDALL